MTQGTANPMTLAFGMLVMGSFPESAVHALWSDRPLKMTAEVAHLIADSWASAILEAGSLGRDLFAGAMTRLLGSRVIGAALTLELGPTDFREFVGTNVRHPELVERFGRDALANPLGVSVAVLTSDGQLVVQRRSEQVFEYPGFFHVCGGNVEPVDVVGPNAPGVFAAVRRELEEELGIGSEQIARLTCLSLAENLETFKPDLLFVAEVTLPAAAFHATQNEEYSTLVFIGGEAALTKCLIENRQRFTPPGMACLLATGRHEYGDRWYEDTLAGIRI
jgi:8-oxo-dGTP pyrophosphatase MutT (NUDIX family)